MKTKNNKLKNPSIVDSWANFSLLDFASSLHPDVSLENTYVIGEQHLVSTTFELIKSLFKKGLKKENLSLIGKCYSTNPYVYAQMIQEGIDVSIQSLTFDPLKSYDVQYRRAVEHFYRARLKEINKRQVAKVIILSDGGALNEILQDEYANLASSLVGVEQTSSGYEKLKNRELHYPIINVARSDAKLQHESPFIARLTLERLFSSLVPLNLHPRKVLIIGNGAIGSQIYNLLQPHFEVEIFDIDETKGTISKKDFENSLSQFDLILGCTGKKIFSKKHYRLLKKNAILASISSSDREFDAVILRQLFKGKITDCHRHLFIDNIYLMNCGFPLIFDSSYDIIDTPEFQLTRSLLLAGILQGASSVGSDKKMISLDHEDQREIVQKYHEMFGIGQKINQARSV